MRTNRIRDSLGFICIALLVLLSPTALAQNQGLLEGVAEYVRIDSSEVRDGDIVVLEGSTYRRSTKPYDSQLWGVVNLQPAVALNVVGSQNTYPVVTQGRVHVNVSTANGAIEPGQFVTSSEKPGTGMLATQPGIVLGKALEGYGAKNSGEVGQIPVALDIHFATLLDGRELQNKSISEQVQDLLVTGAAAVISQPNKLSRYVIAGIVALVSVLLGFVLFGRSAANGVMAIGRNPLARRSILLAITFNVFLTVVFTAAGLAAAFVILAG